MSLSATAKVVTAETWAATIWIAGDLPDIRLACRHYTLKGLCVTVTPTTFVFTGGVEEGAAIGLINYPRFPKEASELDREAESFAHWLVERLCQQSCSVVMPSRTIWLSRRTDEIANQIVNGGAL